MLSRSNRFLLTVWVCFLILMTIVNFSHASEIYHNGSTSAPDLGSAVVQPDYTLRRVFVVGDATAYTYATLNSIGVSIKATSTYYANNRAEVYYRETGDSTWIAAHELSISPYDRTYYAAEYWWYGSIVNLTTDTEYDIRVVIIPSGGGSSIVDTYSTVKTRHEPGRGTILQTLYVSKSGSDSNSGTESAPFLTIQHAVDQASAGTKIKVAAGAYRENITISRNGTSANPIVLEGGDGVILDGHTVLSGTWTLDADDLYYIGSVTEYPSSIDVGTAVQTENRTRVYEYCSSEYAPSNFDLDDLRNRAAEVADLSVSWAPHYTVYGGWYYDDVNDRVYLRVPDDSNINNLSVWAGDDGTAIVINGNFIIVQGFDIRYYKKAITSSHQRFCIIRDNDIYRCQSGIEFLLLNSINGEDLTGLPDWSTLGTAGYSDGHYAGCLNEGTIVEYNTVTDPDTYAWGYGRGKTKPTIETTSIQVSGPGTIVRYNYTQGFFKGISASWDVSNANRDLARDVDMYNNIVCESISDSFEPEGNLINVRIWGNRCRDMWTGVSIAPVRYGPMYVWKNIFIDHGLTAFKLSSSTTGYTYIYNNTVKTDVPGIPGWRNS
ncbi:DUF1565 domain-containing protein, partial [Candidatus Pacearchaeota archaeon]|nr:DUF1565 domain-containing protein [Candidatus Pacearchaeota archaeon]